MRRRSLLIVTILIAALAMVPLSSRFLRGSLMDDRVTALADTDRNATLSTREMRRVIVKMLQAIITHDLAYDVNTSGVTDNNDLILLAQSIRSFLSAVCGNSALEAGEQCDQGSENGVRCTTESANHACQYCSSACRLTMYTPPAVCGNGFKEPGEGCDDGNSVSQDDCSATCSVETHYACVDYACTSVPGFGPNACGNQDQCLPPRNDGIAAEITASRNPITMYDPTVITITIHPDKIRTGVVADITLALPDNGLDAVSVDSRCTRVRDAGSVPNLHLTCSLGTMNPGTAMVIPIHFESIKCAGKTSSPTGIFDVQATLLIKDSTPRPADAPPIFPLKVGLPYKCTTPPFVVPGSRIDATCTAGRFGYASNDFYIGLAHVDDPIRRESHIFTQRTSFFRYFRYSDDDRTIGPETISIEGPGFVYDARWDSVRNVIFFLYQGYDRTSERLVGNQVIRCFDPATKLVDGGACPGTVPSDLSGFSESSSEGYRSTWRRCFLNAK